MFFSIDGVDGVGKSTQMSLFCDWLRSRGEEVVSCRDPGSTPLGERIRDILLHAGADTPIDRRAEMLLYMAARAQLTEEVIRPALAEGKTVVSDRFLLANLAYQGHAGGVDVASIRRVGQVTTGDVLPDCVFLLDMAPEAARDRLARDLDRMENQTDGYRQRVRAGFLKEAERPEHHAVVIDASRPIDEVQTAIRAVAEARMSESRL